jgi:tripartite-type tricarboxylate transporter receptor subunit TctC
MKLPRRQFLHVAAGAAALPALPRFASALDYPTRPVRIVVGFPAGGTADITARLMGQWLSQRLGSQFLIDNRVGARGNIGTELVARAPSDGYTLLQIASANAINVTLYDNLSFDFTRDIIPVACIARLPFVMVENLTVLARTVPEFIAYAKANPGKINMGSGGPGPHLAGELFNMMAGVEILDVQYKGSAPALTDLLGGQIQVAFSDMSSVQFISAGKLRALAVTAAKRSDALSDIPTLGDFVPGFEASQFFGIGVPKNTPGEIIYKLNAAINAGLTDPQIKARLADLGGVPMPMTPGEFGKLIVDETEKWAKVIKFAGIKPE